MYCGKCGREAKQSDRFCGLCGTALASNQPQQSEDGIPSVAENIDNKQLQRCPKCQHTSLYWNHFTSLHECFNPQCRKDFTRSEYTSIVGQQVQPEARTPYERQITQVLRRCPHCGQGMLLWEESKSMFRCLNVECRHIYTRSQHRKWRLIGPIRRGFKAFVRGRWFIVALGLAIIFLSIGYYPSIFGQSDFARWMEIPLEAFGAILALIGLLVGTHLKRITFANALLILLILFTVGSTAYYHLDKSGKISAWVSRSSGEGTVSGNIKEKIPSLLDYLGGLRLETVEPTPVPTRPPIQTPSLTLFTPRPTPTIPPTNESYVLIDHSIVSGADGRPIVIVNNPNAKNPSWTQLVTFLQQDTTDRMFYDKNSFMCGDFAEMLHNNAEKAGWRTAYVIIGLSSSIGGHALNAFQTTDRGLVYIDCTGASFGKQHPQYMDKVVRLIVGSNYVPECIFPEPGWSCTYESVGLVTEIEVIQW